MVYNEQIFSNNKLANSFNEEALYSMDLVKNLTISNFSYSTHYSMSLSINYYTNNLTLSSEPLHFYTFEESEAKKTAPKSSAPVLMHVLFVVLSVLILIFFCGIITGKLLWDF